MLKTKIKFHATAEISEHVDLIKYENFSDFQKNANIDTIFGFYFLRNSIL